MKDKNTQKGEVANSLVLVLQFSINVIVPIIICTIAGLALTRSYGSKGFTIVGILVGIVAAFNSAYRMVKKYLKNEESPGQRARRLEESGLEQDRD